MTSINAESNQNNNFADSSRMLTSNESLPRVLLSSNNNINRSSVLVSKFPLLSVITSRNEFPPSSTHKVTMSDENLSDLLAQLYENTCSCRNHQMCCKLMQHCSPTNDRFPLLKQRNNIDLYCTTNKMNIRNEQINKQIKVQKCVININKFPITKTNSHRFPLGMHRNKDIEDCIAPFLTTAQIRSKFHALAVQLNDIKLYPIFYYFHIYINFPLKHSRYMKTKNFPMDATVHMDIIKNSSNSTINFIHQVNTQQYDKLSIDHSNNGNNNADADADANAYTNANENEIVDLIKTSMTPSIATTIIFPTTTTTTTTTTVNATTTAKYGHERENQVQMENRTKGREPHESNDVLILQQKQEKENPELEQQQARREQQQHVNDAIITANIEFIFENSATKECERHNIDINRDLLLSNFNNKNVPTPTPTQIQTQTRKIIEHTPAISANLFDQQQVVKAEQPTSASLYNTATITTATTATVTSDNDLSHQSHPAVRSDVHDTSSQAVVNVDSDSGSGSGGRSSCCVVGCVGSVGCVGGVSIGTCESLYTSRPNFKLLLAQVPSDQRQRQCVDCVYCAAECVDELLIAENVPIDSGNDWQETEISVDVLNVKKEKEIEEEKEGEVLAMTLTKVVDFTVAEAVADVQTETEVEVEVDEVEVEAEEEAVQLSPLPLSDNQTLNEIMKYEMKSVKAGLPLSTVRAVTLKPEQSTLNSVTTRNPPLTLSSGRLLDRDARLSVDSSRRYGSKISEVPRTQSEVSRSVSMDTLNGGVLPTRTRLRRQRRMQSQDGAGEEDEDPIVRLNRLRARISGALSEVKGVLKQYSTETEDNPQSGNQMPGTTARKPIEPSTTATKQSDGPVQFRFVRKVRRRSIFNEEDEHKETSDTKLMEEKPKNEIKIDNLKSMEEVKNTQTLTEINDNREHIENKIDKALKTPTESTLSTTTSTKAIQSKNENGKIVQEQNIQQSAHTVNKFVSNKTAENINTNSNSNKELNKVESIKEHTDLNVEEKSLLQKHLPFKRNSAEKSTKCPKKSEFDKSVNNMDMQQENSSLKTNSMENIIKSMESSDINSTADILNKEPTQRRSSLKSNLAEKIVKPHDKLEFQKTQNFSDKQDKNLIQKGLSVKANSTDNIVKCVEKSEPSIQSENRTQRRSSFNSIKEIQKKPENSIIDIQKQGSREIPKIEISMEKMEKISVPTTLETVKEEPKPIVSKTKKSPITQVESTEVDAVGEVTAKPKRRLITKPKDGVRRASIAAVESSKIEPPIKVATTLDLKAQRRPSDSETIIKKKASSVIASKTGTDVTQSVVAVTRKVKVIKRPSLKGNAGVASTSVTPTMTTTTSVKAIETKVVDKVANDNAATAIVNETETIAVANNSNKDAMTKETLSLSSSPSSTSTKTLPTQLVIDDAALTKLNETTATTTKTTVFVMPAKNETIQDLIVPTAITTTTAANTTAKTWIKQTGVENNAMALLSPSQVSESNSQTQTTQVIGDLVLAAGTATSIVEAKDVEQQRKVLPIAKQNKSTNITLSDSSASVNEVEKRINQEIILSVAPDLCTSAPKTSQQVSAVRDNVANDINNAYANANNNSNSNSSSSSGSSSGVNKRANANINAFVAPQTVEQSLSATSSSASASAVVIAADISDVVVVVVDAVDVDVASNHNGADTKTLGAPIDSNSVTATTVSVTSSTATKKGSDTRTQTQSTMPELKVGLAPVQAVQLDIKTDGAPPFNEPKEDFAKKKVIYKKIVRQNSIEKAAATIKKKSKDESAPNEVPRINIELVEVVEVVPVPENSLTTDGTTELSDAEPAPIPEPVPEPPQRPPRKVKKKVIIRRQQRKLSISDTFFKETDIEPIAPEVETLEKAIAYVSDDEYDKVDAATDEPVKPLKTCMHLREYEVGDVVMYAERFKKTQVRWKKGRVIERITSISYKLEVEGKEVPAHISYIKRFTDRRVNFGSKEYLEIDYEQIVEEEKKARSYSIWNMV